MERDDHNRRRTMAHDHSFDCRQCGAHLDSQEELNRHMREKHSAQGQSSNQSSQGSPGSSSNTGRQS
jgi:hypothetical protein